MNETHDGERVLKPLDEWASTSFLSSDLRKQLIRMMESKAMLESSVRESTRQLEELQVKIPQLLANLQQAISEESAALTRAQSSTE